MRHLDLGGQLHKYIHYPLMLYFQDHVHIFIMFPPLFLKSEYTEFFTMMIISYALDMKFPDFHACP